MREPSRTIGASRWDLGAFIGTFFLGVGTYFALRWTLPLLGIGPGFVQVAVTAALVLIMTAYAVLVATVPRLRVRLDQAGDNAYYLGLLFTLMSMAVALWEFGHAVLSQPPQVQATQFSGARQIISNFGIALASTVTGIFLRVVLNQMRVDPADVESMTRIELAEASKRVRANLYNVTIDLSRFHDEVRQRTEDVLASLIDYTKKASITMADDVQRATHEVVASTQNAQEQLLTKIAEFTGLLGNVSTEAVKAAEQLKAVSPPPLVFAKRLERMTDALESIGEPLQQLIANLNTAGDSAEHTNRELTGLARSLQTAIQDLTAAQKNIGNLVESSVSKVAKALDEVGEKLNRERALLAELESQSRRSAQEANRAQEASVAVLTSLTKMARTLATVIRQATPTDNSVR